MSAPFSTGPRWQLHAQWGPRPATVEAQAELLVDLFDLLHTADDRLVAWLHDDKTLAGARDVPRDEQLAGTTGLLQDLATGIPPVARLGVYAVPTPGTPPVHSSVDAVLGSTDRFDPNLVTWWPIDCAERVIAHPTAAESVLRAVIALLDPDWAAWTTDEFLQRQRPDPDEPKWGWLTYVAHRLGPAPQPPTTTSSTEFVHRGQLIRIGDDARVITERLSAI
jgi:hypothetical protein